MTDFEKILSLILEKNPTRLIVKPTTKTLIAGFGIKKIIKLSDYTNYLEFKICINVKNTFIFKNVFEVKFPFLKSKESPPLTIPMEFHNKF